MKVRATTGDPVRFGLLAASGHADKYRRVLPRARARSPATPITISATGSGTTVASGWQRRRGRDTPPLLGLSDDNHRRGTGLDALFDLCTADIQ